VFHMWQHYSLTQATAWNPLRGALLGGMHPERPTARAIGRAHPKNLGPS